MLRPLRVVIRYARLATQFYVDTLASRRRPNVSSLKMGLFLYVAGPKPTEATSNENAVRCEGLHNQTYVCEVGHCCGNSQCCSYYYELWWFWLVWAIIFILSCCCVCHHRRTKHRLQQQQRQHEINLIAYREAHNYNSMPFYLRFLPNYLLPDYEEVVNRPPTPPPPYSALNSGEASLPSPHSPGDQPTSLLLPPSLHTSPHSTTIAPTTNTTTPPPDALLSPRPGPQDIIDPPPHYQHKAPGESGGLEKRGSRGSMGSGGGGDGGGDGGSTGDLQKEPLLGELLPQAEEKEGGAGGRHRRSTGDSGIEVCVCGRGGGGGVVGVRGGSQGSSLEICDPKAELEGLLSADERNEGSRDSNNSRCNCGGAVVIGNGFPDDCCEACTCRTSVVHEGQVAVERRGAAGSVGSPSSQLHPPICLLLHTINEQEASHCTGTESES